MIKTIALVFSLLALTACAGKTIRTQNFEGDVHVRSLVVEFDPIDILGQEEDSAGSIFSLIKEAGKIIQEFGDVLDDEKSLALNRQLVEFQTRIVSGLRARTGLPLVIDIDSTPILDYGDTAELQTITFTYPEVPGPYVDLNAQVFYSDVTSLTLSTSNDSLQSRRLKVRPGIDLRIRGENGQGDRFWNESFGHTSREEYILANDYVLGVSTDRVKDKEIFLLPLADGLSR